MQFIDTHIGDAYIIEIEPKVDERGFFARTFCEDEFKDHGLNPRVTQCNITFNQVTGTLRGLHYQKAPYAEAKLVRCTRGAIYDIVLDLRSESSSFCQWFAVELTAENRHMVYIPQGCAHGFLTLDSNCEVFYQISEIYHPEASSGVRWNDPAFGITLPNSPTLISPRDLQFPDFIR